MTAGDNPKRRVLLAAFLWFFGMLSNAEEPSTAEDGNELLQQVVLLTRTGHLEGAWHAYVAFLEDSNGSHSLIRANNCDRENGPCPRLGRLGALLGKTRAELIQSANTFCGRKTPSEPNCMNWVEAELSLLWNGPVPRDESAALDSARGFTLLPLGWSGGYSRENANELRPAADIVLHGKPLRAMIDTGSTLTKLTADDTSTFDVVGSAAVRQVHTVARRVLVRTPVQFGRSVHHIEATLDTTRGRQDTGRANIIGMNVLLQHAAVCFSWHESMLYLGRLGPCAEGHVAYKSGLTASFLPFVGLRGHDHYALVDTGADTSYCAPAIYGSSGDHSLVIGSDPSMSLMCKPFISNPLGREPHIQAIVGNESLQRFGAFGWTRTPFQVYFVPSLDDTPSTISGG